ncbi:solute carrier family 66 member 3 isoform X1 [Myxocyprinus asiaticus]|uniref:solute carrier family 66 member 3 isoform X1 n=1 Tax=Myxocyprinus asiaticus TaxID=70543 RepID=UPI002223E500|nr:solute carrier family 66 member 3 isoform X1 [Myxocyprinus asiaticus]
MCCVRKYQSTIETETAGDTSWHLPKTDYTPGLKGQELREMLSEMDGNLTLHFANFSTLFVCMVLKFPQIFVLMRAKATTGVSLNSLLLELIGFIVFMSYQMYYDYPPLTYLEYPILIAQDVVVLLLILHYNRNMKHSIIYAAVFVGGWQLLTVQKWVIDLAMCRQQIGTASVYVAFKEFWTGQHSHLGPGHIYMPNEGLHYHDHHRRHTSPRSVCRHEHSEHVGDCDSDPLQTSCCETGLRSNAMGISSLPVRCDVSLFPMCGV